MREKALYSSTPYLLVFCAVYFALSFIGITIGVVFPWQTMPPINNIISLMILVLPAWVAARRFLRVEGRSPTKTEAIKLAISSYLIALVADGLMISFGMRLEGTAFAEQLSELQRALSSLL